MKLTIHRGTNQIGGCITEIKSGDYKVFIDFCEQLPGMESKKLLPIDGLTCGDVSKHNFPKELVLKALNYMRKENIVPVGWGKYIDKRE